MSSFAFSVGNILAWTAPAGLIVKDPKTSPYDFPVSDEELSYIASSMALAASISCVPAGLLINKIGRKLSLLSTTISSTIGWLLIIFADSVTMLIIGRIFLGITLGISCTTVPVYIGEISQKEYRGFFCSFFQLILMLGCVYVYLIGYFEDILWLTILCLVIPIIFGPIFLLLPETPNYLIIKSKPDKAEKALKWFRDQDSNISEEISLLIADEKERREINHNRSLLKILKKRPVWKSLMIVVTLGVLLQASGINAITFYMTEIFKEAGTDIKPSLQTIIVGLMQLLMSFSATFIVEWFGRKNLLVGSLVTMVVSLVGLGTHFFIKEQIGLEGFNLDWLPLSSMLLYNCAFSIGLGVVAYVLFGEICGNDIKGFAIGTAMTVNWATAFLVTKFYVNLVQSLKIGPTFWLFAVFNFLGAIFVIIFIPETQGKSLSEIQDEFSK